MVETTLFLFNLLHLKTIVNTFIISELGIIKDVSIKFLLPELSVAVIHFAPIVKGLIIKLLQSESNIVIWQFICLAQQFFTYHIEIQNLNEIMPAVAGGLIACLIPVAVFALDSSVGITFEWEYNTIFDKVVKTKSFIFTVLLSLFAPALLWRSSSWHFVLFCIFIFGCIQTIMILIRSCKWIRSVGDVYGSNSYRHKVNDKYLEGITKPEEMLKVWRITWSKEIDGKPWQVYLSDEQWQHSLVKIFNDHLDFLLETNKAENWKYWVYAAECLKTFFHGDNLEKRTFDFLNYNNKEIAIRTFQQLFDCNYKLFCEYNKYQPSTNEYRILQDRQILILCLIKNFVTFCVKKETHSNHDDRDCQDYLYLMLYLLKAHVCGHNCKIIPASQCGNLNDLEIGFYDNNNGKIYCMTKSGESFPVDDLLLAEMLTPKLKQRDAQFTKEERAKALKFVSDQACTRTYDGVISKDQSEKNKNSREYLLGLFCIIKKDHSVFYALFKNYDAISLDKWKMFLRNRFPEKWKVTVSNWQSEDTETKIMSNIIFHAFLTWIRLVIGENKIQTREKNDNSHHILSLIIGELFPTVYFEWWIAIVIFFSNDDQLLHQHTNKCFFRYRRDLSQASTLTEQEQKEETVRLASLAFEQKSFYVQRINDYMEKLEQSLRNLKTQPITSDAHLLQYDIDRLRNNLKEIKELLEKKSMGTIDK